MTGLTIDEINEIVKTITSFKEVEKIILFGSRAMGNHKPGSDVDLCICGDNISTQMVTKISYMLNQETVLPYFFDVISHKTIDNDALLKHIAEEGVVMWEREKEGRG